MRLLLTALVGALLLAPAAEAKSPRPYVYVVVIDGLDGDRVDDGKAPYIASLLAGQEGPATYYQESRALIVAETNPNHTAMITGAYTNRSGVAGNGYAIYRPVKEDTCVPTGPRALDKPPTPTGGEDKSCLLAQSVFEAIKRQGNPDGLVSAAIMGKPKLAAIFSGKNADPERRDVDYLWAPCSSSLEGDEEYCDGDVQRNPATGYALTDELVMDEVIETIRDGAEVDGKRVRPNFTFVNLPQVDSAGHAFGVGAEYDTAIDLADDEIERLVGELKAQGLWEASVLMILSDHSMDTTLQKDDAREILESGGIDGDEFVTIGNGSAAMVYLTDRTSPDRFELLKRMREVLLADPAVVDAAYREPNPGDGGWDNTIDGLHPGWHAAGERTGDLLIMHAPGGAFLDTPESSNPLNEFAPRLPGQHGAPQTRDNFFAVIGGGSHVRQQSLAGEAAPDFDDTLRNPEQAENVDPAPTIMGLFGLVAPADSRGRFLKEAFSLRRLPGRGAADRPRVRARYAGGGRGRGCRVRRYRAILKPTGARFRVQLRRGRKVKTLARDTGRTKLKFRVREGRRYKLVARRLSASGKASKASTRKLDLRRACSTRG